MKFWMQLYTEWTGQSPYIFKVTKLTYRDSIHFKHSNPSYPANLLFEAKNVQN